MLRQTLLAAVAGLGLALAGTAITTAQTPTPPAGTLRTVKRRRTQPVA